MMSVEEHDAFSSTPTSAVAATFPSVFASTSAYAFIFTSASASASTAASASALAIASAFAFTSSFAYAFPFVSISVSACTSTNGPQMGPLMLLLGCLTTHNSAPRLQHNSCSYLPPTRGSGGALLSFIAKVTMVTRGLMCFKPHSPPLFARLAIFSAILVH